LQIFVFNTATIRLLRHSCFSLTLILALTAFLPTTARAQLSPAPDGGYPNGNTAEGTNALFSLTGGVENTAIGFEALNNNTTGGLNTATGSLALHGNTSGGLNTATGYAALVNNTTGDGNTAIGEQALFSNTAGFSNTANGGEALFGNITGTNNTANGFQALYQNTTGYCNTANGSYALNSNTTANYNTATGVNALFSNTTGNNNSASGRQALYNNATGSNNIALGTNAGSNLTTSSNNIDIGAVGVAGDAGKIRIGTKVTHNSTFIAGISGTTVASGVGVIINADGQLGTVQSSVRFKEAIRPMDKTSEAILALKPATFRYKHELDPEGIPQFGLVAEEVEKVNPDLVASDADGKVYSVRYEAVNAMLLNEFLKEHRNVAELQSTIAELKTTVAQQQNQIAALTATVRKVSERVELSAPAPRIAADED